MPNTVGIERIWKWRASSGCASVSILTSTKRPPYCCSSRSSIGPSVLHGPHHGAQKSSTTGVRIDVSITSAWNRSRVVSIIAGFRRAPSLGHARRAARRVGDDANALPGRELLAAGLLDDCEDAAVVGAHGDLERRPVAQRLLRVAAEHAARHGTEHPADDAPAAAPDVRAGDAADDCAGAGADVGRLVALETHLADRLDDAGLHLHRAPC